MPILPIESEQLDSNAKNTILRTRSQEITDFKNPEVLQLIQDMHATLQQTKNGIGLAAPQVGKNLRIFVASPQLRLKQTVFINPVITKISEKIEVLEEGCLSVPDIYGKIKRSPSLRLEAYNENGRKFKMKVEKLIAQLVQHEIDHLDGILFIDKVEELIEKPKETED